MIGFLNLLPSPSSGSDAGDESRMSFELELPSRSLALSVVDQTRQTPAWCCSILCAAALHIRRHWAPRAASMEASDNLLNFLMSILLLGEGETLMSRGLR